MHDINGKLIEVKNFIIKPVGFSIPYNAEKIHGISTERALKEGVDIEFVFDEFEKALQQTTFTAGHNIEFDIKVWGAEFLRSGRELLLLKKESIDTKNESTDYCALPGGKGGKFKWPTLTELHTKLFNETFAEAHNASADVEATTRCFLELIRLGVIGYQRLKTSAEVVAEFRKNNPSPIKLLGLNIKPYESLEKKEEIKEEETISTEKTTHHSSRLKNISFSHLHNHSQYSVLQSTSELSKMVKKAAEYKMPALALTDSGNMMASFEFVKEVFTHNKKAAAQNNWLKEKGEEETETIIKPIVGCEFNICRNHKDKTNKDNGYQVVLLAKNEKGYLNLAKMSSIAYIDGFYYVPRIDKEILLQYRSDIIVTTGGAWGEIPSMILNIGEEQAERSFLWYNEHFGEDFYAELLRHDQPEEEKVNEVLLNFCNKHNVKYFAANNTFYLNKEDANAHDILLCVKDGEKKETPIGKGRGLRFGFPNDQYYFKSQEEMKSIFADLPEAIITTNEIAEKITPFKLERNVLLPKFAIPDEFKDPLDETDGGVRGENAYLRFLTYEGAKKRYPDLTAELRDRLDFELKTIENTGYPGYFLIVQDFTTEARRQGVSVGPGRGSAAGSAVAYCVGITNIDPIKYDLLFERFLNPERVSLPDIDIDFDDEGRDKIIDYVVNKYGSSQVAQIITYGTMAAKSAIRDAARVLDLPLPDADKLAKLIPNLSSLADLLDATDSELKIKLQGDDFEMAKQLRTISKKSDLSAQTINQAKLLEGSLRNTGIHACGVIITPDDITKFIPVATAKDSELYVTQFDNSVVESAGLLKMDFLGLKTLTIIKDAVKLIKEKHGIQLDPDEFPLDDEKTYQLYQRGDTNGTFQFESVGMQKYLRELKPDKFGDLIAMNALFRPGPLEYIPNFIRRKHGIEPITYDLPDMKEFLEETYGITVYQEQVMLLSQKLAGFSKGKADELRKAMGKKIRAKLDEMKPVFIEGCAKNGHDVEKVEKIWKDWEAFASYAFNKSHSTCYAYLAFQTAYLKAHYPAEYMAAVLTHNMSDIKKVTFFMEECRRMRMAVLGPSVNESELKFTVNEKGEIRFGLGAIKGVGENAVESIVSVRKENGPYKSIFDFTKRIDLRAANKKTMENLALGGAFDCFNISRSAYFSEETEGHNFLSKVIKYGNNFQDGLNSAQQSLFGEETNTEMPEPLVPKVEEWQTLHQLNREKEVVGIYISGHPLNDYRLEIDHLCTRNITMETLNRLGMEHLGREFSVAGIITKKEERTTKTGKPFGTMEVEDFAGMNRFMLFGDDYLKCKNYIHENHFVFIRGRVQNRKFGNEVKTDEFEFKVTYMDNLSHIREKLVKWIHIPLAVNDINEKLVEGLDKAIKESKGNVRIKVLVTDPLEKIKLDLPSLGNGVNPTNEFIRELENMGIMEYRLQEHS